MTRVRAVSGRDAVVVFFSVLTAAAYVYVVLVAALPHPFPSPALPGAPELIERIGRVIVPITPPTAEPRPAAPAGRSEVAAAPESIDSTPSAAAVGVPVTPSLETRVEDAVARPARVRVARPARPRAEAPRPAAVDAAGRPGKTKHAAQGGPDPKQRDRDQARRSTARDQVAAVVERSPAPAKRGGGASPQRSRDANAGGKSRSRTNGHGLQKDHGPQKDHAPQKDHGPQQGDGPGNGSTKQDKQR